MREQLNYDGNLNLLIIIILLYKRRKIITIIIITTTGVILGVTGNALPEDLMIFMKSGATGCSVCRCFNSIIFNNNNNNNNNNNSNNLIIFSRTDETTL